MLSIGQLPHPGTRTRALSRAAAAGVLALAVLAGTGSAASAGTGPVAEPGSDGSCDTRPTNYPADGEPVPDNAGCALLTDDAALVVGETWSWADSDSVQWYSYVAATAGVPVGGSVVMCGSTDSGQQDQAYPCSPDSTYLLFTVDGVFVEWPNSLATDLYYCELTTFGTGDTAVLGRACGTVPSLTAPPPGDGDGGTAETGPTATPTPSDPPVEPESSSSPTPTVEPPGDDAGADTSDPTVPDATDDTSDDAPVVPPAEPTTTTSTAALPSASSAVDSTAPADGPTATPSAGPATEEATAITSESVARVGGSPVPMGFLLVLAGALALGGYLMLAGPGFAKTLVAARRQRR